jgi:dTDP-4-dehydrorhamnose 3,5-epimerase
MRFTPAPLPGIVIIDLEVHRDRRGGFARTFCEREFAEQGLPTTFPQCNLSFNHTAGTLRGLHFNAEPYGECKLVRCVRGAIRDILVDLRSDSPTRFEWTAVELDAESARAVFAPAGFAHGFVTLEDHTDVYYHMGSDHRPDASRTVRWDDPAFGIDWGMKPTEMSEADAECRVIDPTAFDLRTYGG